MNKLMVLIQDSNNNKSCIDLSKLLSFGQPLAERIIKSLIRYIKPYNNLANGKKLRQILNMLGVYYGLNYINLNNADDLYTLLHNFRAHWYTTKDIRARIDVRNGVWDIFKNFMNVLMKDGVFIEVPIPPGNHRLHKRDVLSIKEYEQLSGTVDVSDECIKSLVPISLARTDSEYLDELEVNFSTTINTFLKCAKKEIDVIHNAKKEGDRMVGMVDYEMLTALVNKTITEKRPYLVRPDELMLSDDGTGLIKVKKKIDIFGPNHPMGYHHSLARIRYEHNGYYYLLNNHFLNSPDRALRRLQEVAPSGKHLSAHLGYLTSRRAVPFFVFILLKNPRFNPESLINVEVTGKNGITKYLSTAGDVANIQRMKVVKKRAMKEKSSLLDEECSAVVKLLIELTSPLRAYLQEIGDENYKKLWLVGPAPANNIPHRLTLELMRRQFKKSHKYSDLDFATEENVITTNRCFLASHKILTPYASIATLAKLRVTAGLVEWFRSGGDPFAVARTLGNTVRVTVEHYIPHHLQLLMNTRTIRRFQNLLLIAATAGEPYMLEVADFNTIEEVHVFLKDMLDGRAFDHSDILSRVSDYLYSTVSKSAETVHTDIKSKVALNISVSNLTVLFLYENHISKYFNNFDKLISADKSTKTTPLFWKDLSQTVKFYCENTSARKEIYVVYKSAIDKLKSHQSSINFPSLT